MKFRCESCGAQYAIADEKVGKKGVKVKCKKCSQIITVRPEAAPAAPVEEPPPEEQREPTAVDRTMADGDAPAAEQASSEPRAGAEVPREEEELRSALDNILGDEGLPPGGTPVDEEEGGDLDRASTRVFNVEEMQQVQAEREKASMEEPAAGSFAGLIAGDRPAAPAAESGEGEVDRDRVEWYAAVDEQQVGPLSLADFAARVERGELDAETLVWKTGFGDWLPAAEVPEMRAVLAEREAPQDEPPAGEAAGGAEEEPAWSARATRESWGDEDEEREPAGRGVQDDAFGGAEDEAEDGEEDYGGRGLDADPGQDEESSNAASAQAFAGADVDWKPSAVSALSSLAEEELASLRPVDPEPERPSEEEALLGGADEGPAGDMEDGDSSLISQIAAEEEDKARRAEEQRLEEERVAELKRQREEEEAALAQAAAKREQEEERRLRVAPPPQAVPPRAVLPKWAIGLMAGGGVMLLVLVGLVGYILASSQNPATPEPGQMQPLGPAERVAPVPAPASPVPAEPAPAPVPGAPEAGVAKPEPAPAPVDAAGVVQPPPAPEPAAVVAKPEPAPVKPVGSPKPAGPVVAKTREPKPPKPPKPAVKVPAPAGGRDGFGEEEDEPIRPQPEAKPAPAKKSGGGLLDFEDEDDRALAKDMGLKKDPVKAEAAPAPVKQDLPPLSNADVLEVMKQHIEEFKACNKEQKKRDASVQGKMVVNFLITPDGKVKSVSVDPKTGAFKGTFVAECISQTIKRLRFPAFGGGAKSVPFPFTVK